MAYETDISKDQMKNKFYSEENITKLCVEGAIGNLLNVLGCSEEQVNQFWKIAMPTFHLLPSLLNENIYSSSCDEQRWSMQFN